MTRSLRADAQRNRARLLEVAEKVFAERGINASTEEIARAAGVGIGTVFRHFPTKEALVEAVYRHLLRRLADEVETASRSQDPEEALLTVFTLVADTVPAKNAYADALSAMDIKVVPSDKEDLRGVFEVLLSRAQQAGAVREEIRLPDLIALLIGASRALEHIGADPAARARVLTVMFDGLNPRR
jgi:AcrR family transcriptional regulator